MEQGVFFELGEFDRSKVDLNKTPLSAQEYLKQVAVNRDQCPETVRVEMDEKLKKPALNQIPADPSKGLVNPIAPNKECNDFSLKRSQLEGRRKKIPKIKGLDLPQHECASKWREICLKKRHPAVEIPPEYEPSFAHHKGTPPTLRFVVSLSDVQINSLLQHLIEEFVDHGYNRGIFEWIYSLLLVAFVARCLFFFARYGTTMPNSPIHVRLE